MDCNKQEAERAKNLAEEKMNAGDFVGARKLIKKAQRLFPSLQNLPQMRAICDVHSSADEKINGLDNSYGILQVQYHDDDPTVKKRYRKLALLLHPDKNDFAGAADAFTLVVQAYRCLSDHINRRSQETYLSSTSRKVPPKTGTAASGPDLAGSEEDHAEMCRFEAEMAEDERELEELRKSIEERAKRFSELDERTRKVRNKLAKLLGRSDSD